MGFCPWDFAQSDCFHACDPRWPPGSSCNLRKGLEGFSHAAGGAGARERGAPESPVFCGLPQKMRPDFYKNLRKVPLLFFLGVALKLLSVCGRMVE
jgi:hypothetical protein